MTTNDLFSEANEMTDKAIVSVETDDFETVKKVVEYIAEVPVAWQVRRYSKTGVSKAFEPLDTLYFDTAKQRRLDEVAKERGRLLGDNKVVEMFNKVYVCPVSGQLRTHKGERIIAENGAKQFQQPVKYKKFNGRRN